jgi:hypothetical protein
VRLQRPLALAVLIAVLPFAAIPRASAAGPATSAASSDYQSVDFGFLSSYPYELADPLEDPAPKPANQIPPRVKALDAKKVAIRGFMLPIDITPEGVSQFILNGTLDMCYFGAPVNINEWVLVKMKDGKRTPFTHTPILVSGTISVGEEMRNGRVGSLYRLQADSAATTK